MSSDVPTVAAVQRFLAARFGDAADVVPFTRGEWSRAFAFRCGGRDLVARFGRYVEDYEKDRVAAGWRSDALPVPEVVEIGEAFDGVYAVSVRAAGTPLEDLDRAQWHAVVPSLLAALAAMRLIEPPGSGFGAWHPDGSPAHGSWRDWLLSVADETPDLHITGWRRALAAVPGAETHFAECHAALAVAAGNLPELRQAVHADLTAGNVLVEDGHITAIFDWANSLAGDPLYDVGWLVFWSPWHPGIDVAHLLPQVRAAFDDEDAAPRIRACALHVGLDAQRYCAWAGRLDELARVTARTYDFVTA